VIELGRGQTDVNDLFIRRAKGLYVVQLFEGEYFRQAESKRTTTQKQVIMNDPLFEPLRTIGIDTPAIRRLLKSHSRQGIQQWLRITDAAIHEKPRGFPGFKSSPAAFLIDGLQHKRTPPDWFHAHTKKQERETWQTKTSDGHMPQQYETERASALQAFLKTPEGIARLTAYRTAFQTFYERVEPYQKLPRE
jgi:hypothetical protein